MKRKRKRKKQKKMKIVEAKMTREMKRAAERIVVRKRKRKKRKKRWVQRKT